MQEDDADKQQEEVHKDEHKETVTSKPKRKGWGQDVDEASEPTARIVSYSDSESDDEHPGPFLAKQLLSGGQGSDEG